jgi:hypothetical protein
VEFAASSPPPPLPNESSAAPAAKLLSRWFEPSLSPLLRDRRLAIGCSFFGALQVVAGFFHFKTFPCPMLYGIGIPCPGCGASRACGMLLHGDVHDMATMNLFAPCFILAAVLFGIVAIFPPKWSSMVVDFVERTERSTGIAKVFLILLFVYWLARLLYAPSEFIRQMRG